MRNQIQIKNDSILLDARLSFYRYKAKEVQMNSLFPFFFTLNQPEDKDIMKKPVLLLLFKKTIFILIYIILI
jgi:hypothetical protein